MKNLTIATRLRLLVALLCALALGIAGFGLRSIAASNTTLRTVYADRMVALSELTEVLRYNLRNQVVIVSAVADRRPHATAQYLAEMQSNAAALAKVWARYEATYSTPHETVLLERFKVHREVFQRAALQPIQQALTDKNTKEAGRLAFEVMPAAYVPMRDDLSALIALQVDGARRLYADALTDYQLTLNWSMGVALAAVALSLLLGYALMRNIARSMPEALVNGVPSVRQGSAQMAKARFSAQRVESGSALADPAAATMSDLLTAVRRVTDIVAAMRSSSNGQAPVMSEVGAAANQATDELSQQRRKA